MTLDHPLPPAGEAAGQQRLERFADLRAAGAIAGYAERRNLMAEDGTSRLSPSLRLGALSPRQCLRAAEALEAKGAAGASVATWVGELIWRDFYVQVLFNHPHVLRGAFRPEYDALQWENDPALLAAWAEGRTGYPVVDAAMRQLRAEGWMHNRARMIVASFLTKDLLVDWRAGERHFMRLLMDGDPAANNGGWQWAAGTGTDAQPFFRIFNPASQGEKFDPVGAYVRRYVPELANVPNKFIHKPHLMAPVEQLRADVQVGRDYPQPIVDHKQQRERALELYGRVRRAGEE
jgi:deoxyribodipyrimidine photo-lyase